MRKTPIALLITLTVTAVSMPIGAAGPITTDHPILFVTQVPVPADFATIGSTFASHLAGPQPCARGGDLYIRYPDGTLRNLTRAAGFGNDGFQGATSIAVRQPCAHWSGDKAVFSMVVGATVQQYVHVQSWWQLYEVTGLGAGETPLITRVAHQPAEANNISPAYASDGTIIFSSDRPRDGAAHLYPQLDEYESTPTVAGLYRLDPSADTLDLLVHTPSGAFWPTVDSAGRVIFTKWDHLQRDQQADAKYMGGNDYGTYNWSSEAQDSVPTTGDEEFFPEPRDSWINYVAEQGSYDGPLRGYEPHLVGHRIELFQPWQVNQDGTEEETLNHVGRHELTSYFNRSFNNDPSLDEFIFTGSGNPYRIRNLFQLRESPATPGHFYAINAPTFGTHASGQIVRVTGGTSVNANDMVVVPITHPDTATASNTPSGAHSGLYRNPLVLANGTLIAAHTTETRGDANEGTTAAPASRYDLRLKLIDTSGTHAVAGASLTGGIVADISYWNPDVLVQYDGPLWELDPVEVVARPAPPATTPALPRPEMQALAATGVSADAVRNALRERNLAMIVSRDVTTRDVADTQQPFNLRVADGGVQTTGDEGFVYDVAYMQLFQGDQIRGIGTQSGRRVLATPMHDPSVMLPPVEGPVGSVRLGADGSMAALVPARRAMTWQLTDDDGNAVVRERYWITFQPGEIRTCTSCHGINGADQSGATAPQNEPQAMTELVTWMQSIGWLDTKVVGDVDGDGLVGLSDLIALLAAWTSGDASADLDGDGIVGFADLLVLLANWS